VESEGVVGASELRAVAARALPAWLQPQVLAVTEQIPRLAGGKANREACHALLRQARGWGDPA
jgi:hypothetical protein